jgi:hypothetical protein
MWMASQHSIKGDRLFGGFANEWREISSCAITKGTFSMFMHWEKFAKFAFNFQKHKKMKQNWDLSERASRVKAAAAAGL